MDLIPPSAVAIRDPKVALKISFLAQIIKDCIALRDVAPYTFDERIREILAVAPDVILLLERWSDSQGSWVVLNPEDEPVYRQLRRAARAKLRLRLRANIVEVTGKEEDGEPPVSSLSDLFDAIGANAGAGGSPPDSRQTLETGLELELEPELQQECFHISSYETKPIEHPAPAVPELESGPLHPDPYAVPQRPQIPQLAPPPSALPLSSSFQLPVRLAPPAEIPQVQVARQPYEPPTEEPCQTLEPLETLETLDPVQEEQHEAAEPSSWTDPLPRSWLAGPGPEPAPPRAISPPFAVCCNECSSNATLAHYHCATCDDGDFDLCLHCIDRGLLCNSKDHWMIKRNLVGNQLISSVTERIPPRSRTEAMAQLRAEMIADTKAEEEREEREAREAQETKEEVVETKKEVVETKQEVVDTKIKEEVEKSEEAVETKVEEKDRAEVPPRKSHANLWDGGPLPAKSPRCSLPTASVPSTPWLHRLTSSPFPPPRYDWRGVQPGSVRTCNCCVTEYPHREFVHCLTCEDYDLCKRCFSTGQHGHHPKHAFGSAVPGVEMPYHIACKMGPGRNQTHHAICDGCDMMIIGVRHKCLDCPDWDYCEECIPTANVEHAGHRFVPLYEPLDCIRPWPSASPIHMGICCDGPLCSRVQGNPSYIRGTRYKCAVCHDTDFCAPCEASPANVHNKTHPLIKLKTPVRHVSVTTTGEHIDGKRMPTMGDRAQSSSSRNESINSVKTVVEVTPEESVPEQTQPQAQAEAEPVAVAEVEAKEVKTEKKDQVEEDSLKAVFVSESIADGTILPPNRVFEQTWVLRNNGDVAWPLGCSVKFVGGDYMGHVNSAHPANISELISAAESTVCTEELAPGESFPFSVVLRTPHLAGKFTSYWRLTTPTGLKFGHRLWCEVNVRVTTEQLATPASVATPPQTEASSQSDSVMVFPKLDNEATSQSVSENEQPETSEAGEVLDKTETEAEGESWDESEDYLTDEEYDILDASDEESLEEKK